MIIWDAKACKEVFRFSLHQGSIQAVCFSPSERFVLTLGGQVIKNPSRCARRLTRMSECAPASLRLLKREPLSFSKQRKQEKE